MSMKKLLRPLKSVDRGERVVGPTGAIGRYVGERRGLIWIAWEPSAFELLCRAFDATGRA